MSCAGPDNPFQGAAAAANSRGVKDAAKSEVTNKAYAKVQQISAEDVPIPVEEECFEMDTVEQEIERSRAGTIKRKPLLSLLLSKRKLQKK